jgi:hypothetical protein
VQKEANHSGTLAPSKRFGANAPIRPKVCMKSFIYQQSLLVPNFVISNFG